MNIFTRPAAFISRIAFVAVLLFCSTLVSAFGQTSRKGNDRLKPDSRKVRREAARYAAKNNAEDYVSSHLGLDNFSFRKGEPGYRPLTEEMQADMIYNGDVPVMNERKQSRKKTNK
jgi:hypothetical protein